MEIAIAKYTSTFSVLIGVVIVLKVAPGVLGISEKVKGVVAEWVFLRLYISLQVGVLGGGEVSRGGIMRV